MHINELQPLNLAQYEKLQTHGVMFGLAHGDDEALVAQTARDLRDQNIPLHFFYATHGEQGIPHHMKGTSLQEMARIRKGEIENAALYFGATAHVADFPDSFTQSTHIALQIELAKVTRRIQPALIISFHPQEITTYFDHLDHTEIGYAARWASQNANLDDLLPEHLPAAMEFRPGLLLWTTNIGLGANRFREISPDTRRWRNEYLATHHQSQFPRESMHEWSTYFDTLFYEMKTGPVELYKFVR